MNRNCEAYSEIFVGNKVFKPPLPNSQEEITKPWTTSNSTPIVSIICATYNHVEFINDALNSFLMQRTNFPFEIIVCDDASSDGTRDILLDYQQKYPSLIKLILHNENQYRLGKRPIQFGLPAAQGKYIAMCEGDDYWISPNKLELQVEAMEEHANVVLSYHDAVQISTDNEFLNYVKPGKDRVIPSRELLKAPFIPTLTRMFRNVDIDWIRDEKLPIAMDIGLTACLAKYGDALYLGDKCLSAYRIHPGGIWSAKNNYEKLRTTTDARLYIAQKLSAQQEPSIDEKTLSYHTDVVVREILRDKPLPQLMKFILSYTVERVMKGIKLSLKKLT